jgi:fibronectin type 3 domain-containing protein
MCKLSIFLLGATLAVAQTPTQRIVDLAWEDTRNPSGTTYSVYRATGLCSGTPSWSKIATALTVKTYEDSTVQPGNYCYQVTATFSGVESAPSNTAAAPVPSFPPVQLQLTVK